MQKDIKLSWIAQIFKFSYQFVAATNNKRHKIVLNPRARVQTRDFNDQDSDPDFDNKENLAAKSKHTDWFDNHETDSDTSLEEKNVVVRMKASGSPAQMLPKIAKSSSKVAKMAINGTFNKDQTSSSSDENTSDDEIKENAAKLKLIQGKEKFILSSHLGTYIQLQL